MRFFTNLKAETLRLRRSNSRRIKEQAIDQLDQYSADPAFVAEWHIGSRGATALPRAATSAAPPVGGGGRPATGTTGVPPVALHRLALGFHGGDCILNEEV